MMLNTAKERPILFSGPMVKEILSRRKTMTRRVIFRDDDHHMPWRVAGTHWQDGDLMLRCPFGEVGDRLWVRETFARRLDVDPAEELEKARHYALYRADGTSLNEPHWHSYPVRWTPAIHMPRWASRIDLEITEVRVERLQAITEEDAKAEGSPLESGAYYHATWFKELWNDINAKRGFGWELNPWVWVVSFRRMAELEGRAGDR